MMIPARLERYIDGILKQTHTFYQWLKLESEVNCYLAGLTEKQQDYFADSGAGELLWMMCFAIRDIGEAHEEDFAD